MRSAVSRRQFLAQSGLAAGGVLLAGRRSSGESLPQQTGIPDESLPTEVLGKTGVRLPRLTLGTGPAGQSRDVSVRDLADLVDAAIDLGITSIDTARRYGKAEESVGLGLGSRRLEVFLSTKVFADTIADAESSLSESLRQLKTDHVDLLYFHNLGRRDVSKATEPDGVFTWLLKQKQAGKTRFVGISGHNLSERFPALIATGEVDAILMVLNFVDRYQYGFERNILPLACKQNLGVVAMKVLGGMRRRYGAYKGAKTPSQLDEQYIPLAIRYALSLPGVATANIGVHTIDQLKSNLEVVRRFTPLNEAEQANCAMLGRKLSADWGPHFGPEVEQLSLADEPCLYV
ncbi:MAG: aldo/keto reductase [Planctomycetota bacterium]